MPVSAAATSTTLPLSTPESPTRIRLRRAEAEGDRRREIDENIRWNLSAVRRVADGAPDAGDNDHLRHRRRRRGDAGVELWIDGAAAGRRKKRQRHRTRPFPAAGELAAAWTTRRAAADDRRNAEEEAPPPLLKRGAAGVGRIRRRIPSGLGARNRRASRAAAAGIDADTRAVDEDGKDEEEENIHGRATKRALVHSREEEEERRSRGWAGANTGAMSGVDNLLL